MKSSQQIRCSLIILGLAYFELYIILGFNIDSKVLLASKEAFNIYEDSIYTFSLKFRFETFQLHKINSRCFENVEIYLSNHPNPSKKFGIFLEYLSSKNF